jgi:hypothetical protein
MTQAFKPKPGDRVCLIVCGANVDLGALAANA